MLVSGLLDNDQLKFDPYGSGSQGSGLGIDTLKFDPFGSGYGGGFTSSSGSYTSTGGYQSTANTQNNAGSGGWLDAATAAMNAVSGIFNAISGKPAPQMKPQVVAQPRQSYMPIVLLAAAGLAGVYFLTKKRRA